MRPVRRYSGATGLPWPVPAPPARSRREVSRSAPDAPAVLIVTRRQRLWQRYGPEGVFAIERAVGDLVGAMAERGLAGTFVYIDDGAILGALGVLPPEGSDADAVARTVRAVVARMTLLEEDARYVLILGGDDVVPFKRDENPSPDAELCLVSDHPYAVDPDAPLWPVRAVGRIPDGSLGMFVRAIRAAADGHRRLASGRGPRLPAESFGFSASVWKRAARSVFAPLGDGRCVRLSPPLSQSQTPPVGRDAPRFRYYNLHGLPDAPHWLGQRDPSFPADYPTFPVALRPEDVAEAAGGLIFSEACYGAHLDGRAVGDSIALTCLARGALGFVGATGVAYGGLDEPLVAADLLAHAFWTGVLDGLPAGEALLHAKRRLLGEAVARQGYLDAEDEKTARNFVLYGDPSLVHHVPSVWAEDAARAPGRDAVGWAGPATPVGTVPVQPLSHSPAALPAVGAAAGALIEHVRRAVARRLPEFAAAEAQVASAPGAGGCVAHAPGAAGDGGAYVVTLSKTIATCDGHCHRDYVRVTVDGRGRIRKVAVSR
jgi:hypothetical protein